MSCEAGTCGLGTGVTLPSDPSNDSTLSATGVFGGVDLHWTYPATNPHAVAYVKLFRGTTDVLASAILVKEKSGTDYFDPIEIEEEYFYWIQLVSVNGTIAEAVGPVSATPRLSIDGVIEQLTGLIDRGLLATTLKNELDQISVVNANLLNEIFDRETGETSLAEAIADVAAGVAEAHTFILDEINTRTSQNSAIAELIDGVVVTLGDDIAAVTTTMTASIDDLTGEVYAMWTAQVTVNGLVGGFGIINDGITVEAGFDVDLFWVGRTSADKVKPFIISGGVVYIDSAVIQDASITNAKLSGDIFSDDYVEDVSGWIIKRTGDAEFFNVKVRGDIEATSINGAIVDTPHVVSGALSAVAAVKQVSPFSITDTTGSTEVITTGSMTISADAQSVSIAAFGVLTAEATLSPFTVNLELVRDSTVIHSVSATATTGEGGPVSGSNQLLAFTVDAPSSGSHTYLLQTTITSGLGTVEVTQGFIQVLQLKR